MYQVQRGVLDPRQKYNMKSNSKIRSSTKVLIFLRSHNVINN